jgi:hypothetical protein
MNKMSNLSKVLAFKIAFTMTVAGIPLLLFPTSLLQWLGFVVPEPRIFLRLLGMAYAALVVGYGFGLRDSIRGIHPSAVIWVGIVSNGGATLMFALAASQNVWGSWGVMARIVMWGSLLSVAMITLGLMAFGLYGSTPHRRSIGDLSGAPGR